MAGKGDPKWRAGSIKEGYVIKFHRGFSVKAPKMQYCVLTKRGLTSYNYRPEEESVPRWAVTFDELSSVKVESFELNQCTLPCLVLTGKTNATFLLAFSRLAERDEWMCATMTAFSEALVTSNHNESRLPAHTGPESTLAGRKRTLRRAKSYNAVAMNALRKTKKEPVSTSTYEPLTKRKSLTDINVITHNFPYAWILEGRDETTSDFDHYCEQSADNVFKNNNNDKGKNITRTKSIGFMSKLRSRFENASKTSALTPNT